MVEVRGYVGVGVGCGQVQKKIISVPKMITLGAF